MATKLTPKQRKAIELLATGLYTQVDICSQIHINPQTMCRWKKKREFMQAVVDRSREMLKDTLPEVYLALSNKSKEGKDRHIKILLDHMERLEEVKAGRTSVTFTWLPPTATNNDQVQ